MFETGGSAWGWLHLQAGEQGLEAAMQQPSSAAEPQSNPWLLGWAVPRDRSSNLTLCSKTLSLHVSDHLCSAEGGGQDSWVSQGVSAECVVLLSVLSVQETWGVFPWWSVLV